MEPPAIVVSYICRMTPDHVQNQNSTASLARPKDAPLCSLDCASKGRAALYLDCIWIISSLFARSMKSNCRKSLSQDKLSRLRHGPETEFGFAGDHA
ncbi:hypothetical protein L2252_11390 [Mesorhizobium muleiense]|nr:hypothetical protein [Mesorhizobium muleiense]